MIRHRLGIAANKMFPEPASIIPPDKSVCISPADSRYWQSDVAAIFAPVGTVPACMAVELAIVKALERRGVCDRRAVNATLKACLKVTPQQVEAEEAITQHDIDALVKCIRANMPEAMYHYLVHFMATSFDIRSTADALCLYAATVNVLVPALIELVSDLIKRALDEANSACAGRTHLQQASPITMGFWFAEYVQRIYERIVHLRHCAKNLRGKFSGAVGAHNDTVLVLDGNPEDFEREVLHYLCLKPADYSNQIVAHDAIGDLMHAVCSTAQVLSCMANDIRILLMQEVGELRRELDPNETGSSIMPHKVNPSRFENVCALARIMTGLAIVPLLNQESNLQRDLRDSGASRVYGDMFDYTVCAARTLRKATAKLEVNHDKLHANLMLTGGQNLAAAYNTLFRKYEHPDPHTLMKGIAQQARLDGTSLQEMAGRNPKVVEYMSKMSPGEQATLADPAKYIGIAPEKTIRVATTVARKLKLTA